MPVYLIRAGSDGPVKIGHATHVRHRLCHLQLGSAEPLLLLGTLDGGQKEERELHARFADRHIRGEWFRFDSAMLDGFSPAPLGPIKVRPLRNLSRSATPALNPIPEEQWDFIATVGKRLGVNAEILRKWRTRGIAGKYHLPLWDAAAEVGFHLQLPILKRHFKRHYTASSCPPPAS